MYLVPGILVDSVRSHLLMMQSSAERKVATKAAVSIASTLFFACYTLASVPTRSTFKTTSTPVAAEMTSFAEQSRKHVVYNPFGASEGKAHETNSRLQHRPHQAKRVAGLTRLQLETLLGGGQPSHPTIGVRQIPRCFRAPQHKELAQHHHHHHMTSKICVRATRPAIICVTESWNYYTRKIILTGSSPLEELNRTGVPVLGEKKCNPCRGMTQLC